MSRASLVVFCTVGLVACAELSREDVALSKRQTFTERTLRVGQRVPDRAEASTIGPLKERIRRDGRGFSRLVRGDDQSLIFKDEEQSGADRLMTPRLNEKLRTLASLVTREWPGVRLRVTEAWDETDEHGEGSVHYEGRAADITTSDVDPQKLGRLASLAVNAGFDWVFYEDPTHVHVSVRN